MARVKILGVDYSVVYRTRWQDQKLERVDGYCDYSTKTIVCLKRTEKDKDPMDLGNLEFVDKRILRHEVLHAFMYESGLWCNSFDVGQWAMNEEMTDWFAIQAPKIYKVYKELGLLDGKIDDAK